MANFEIICEADFKPVKGQASQNWKSDEEEIAKTKSEQSGVSSVNEDSWLKVDKDDKEGFALTVLDSTFSESDSDVCWEVVDEVYLFEDDNQRTLSTTRFKILTLGFFETIGGIALVTSAVPGIMGNVVGCLILQCGADTMKSSIIRSDQALNNQELKDIVKKNCIVGSLGALTSSILFPLPILASSSINGALCSLSSEVLERKQAESRMKLRKQNSLLKATAWGAVTGNIPYMLDTHAGQLLEKLAYLEE